MVTDARTAGPEPSTVSELDAFVEEAFWEAPAYARVLETGVPDRERELLYTVAEAVERYEPIRASLSPVQVAWRDGAVVLRGRVRTRPMKVLAERLARSAAGRHTVVSHLVADDELALDVATALALDPRTALAPVRVEATFGVIHLLGPIPTAAMASAAQAIAAAVPGVARVRAQLQIAAVATPSVAETKAEAGATSPPIAETAFTSEPRLEPHSREQDADRVTRPAGDERVPRADV
jgi:osmotically-inducible protein OsmY